MKDRKKIKKYIINCLIWSAVIFLLGFFYFEFSKEFTVFRDPQQLKDLILSFGSYSIIAFIILQMIQVIVFFIPGEVIQIAGGYIFGPVIGGIVSAVGIVLGSMVAYLIAKLCGKKYINKLIEKNNLTKIKKILDAGSNNIVIFVIYFIPGIPKDVLVYVAGVSNASIKDFIIYSSVGRIPWIVASAVFGHGIHSGNYIAMIAIGIVSGALFIVGILRGHSIIEFFHRKLKHDNSKTSKIEENER
ncbi:MAG: TVP38/TMEM64 family protein [Clostridium sp.]|uniref:TVP38/TMEM64 family protein n=1 Tax=Clostridium sp. TaxID=1506 RepID=UPI003037E389